MSSRTGELISKHMPHSAESAPKPEEATRFSPSQHVSELERLAKDINSPFDRSTIETVITKFERYFKDSAVVFRAKDLPNDPLNYRLFLRNASDTTGTAIECGLLDPNHPFVPLMGLWYSLCHQDQDQAFWPDFSTTKSTLAKTWLRLSPLCSIETLLRAPGIPIGMQNQVAKILQAGLDMVRFIAVEYDASTVNFYFPLPGPLSREQANQITALAGSHPPSESKLQEMKEFVDPRGILFAVTMKYPTGEIPRIAFYAINIHLTPDLKGLPQMKERGAKFLKAVRSYDKNPTTVVSWSFAREGGEYMKLEAGYSGDLENMCLNVAHLP